MFFLAPLFRNFLESILDVTNLDSGSIVYAIGLNFSSGHLIKIDSINLVLNI